jgi:3-oxoadipate enol-lactonase
MKELLHYSLEGQGPLIVLLHPVGLDGRFWYDLPKRLSDHYSVACVDLRGHGRSSKAQRPGTMQANVDDVADVIKSINRGKAIVLGLSFGGMVAQNLALRHPDLVSGLVICACGAQVPQAFRQNILARGTDAEKGGMQAVTATTLERWFTPAFMNAPEVEQVRQRLLEDDPSNFAAAWEAISEHDAVAQLAQVRVPVLVVGGSLDLATSVEAITTLANAFGHAQKVVLEGAPHMMQIENQDVFYHTVRQFLDGMERL